MIFGIGAVIAKCDEILVALANQSSRVNLLHNKIGEFIVSSQQDADQLAQAIADVESKWEAWASNAQTVLTNVENALTAAQQQAANGGTVDLTAAQNALAQAQTAVGNLPTETDPTVAPTPAPTPDPNAGA
ncbi:hypothetical protein [Nocardia vaccinii]|uniref:hypothetical protein n=1 Tax=Nocardia vaccinii TaxID=1822 RepID=UPI00082E0D36|nr:hypothetical protein [Nocardia vaccinii]